MKGTGMLNVALRGVNFRFWSHLGCSGQNAIIQPCSAKDASCEYDELKIYDDAFKNYLWVKVLVIIKSHCIFYLSMLKNGLF